jgi:hypothetical protein
MCELLKKHVIECIERAEDCISNIKRGTEDGDFILNYTGYTGTKTRHFYNNICNIGSESGLVQDVRYLEIGTWTGSSSIAAIYGNSINALFIDNWSQFNGNVNIFTDVMERFKGNNKYYLIESDCWKVNINNIGKFNVYLYDGGHTEHDHFMALDYYIDNMESEFIYIVDDWSWAEVREGTMRGIRENNLEIKYEYSKILSDEEVSGMPNHKGKSGWWNGIGIFVLSKCNK